MVLQENKLFPTDREGAFYLRPGNILIHKKSTSVDMMAYVVHDIYKETEGEQREMVAYQALYGKRLKHVRPRTMFTPDRFAYISSANVINECYARH